jgi:hypothetical protein
VTSLEDEIQRLREEIDALTIYAPPVQEAPEDPDETERRLKIVRLLAEGKPVSDELLRDEEEEEGKVVTEREFIEVLRQMIEDGVFDYPEDADENTDENEPSEGDS